MVGKVEKMDKFVISYKVKDDKLEEYIKAHKEMKPELINLLIKAGVKKMVIFHKGNDMFLYAEVCDIKKYFKIRNTSKISIEWEKYMGTLLKKESLDVCNPSTFTSFKEIWSFVKE